MRLPISPLGQRTIGKTVNLALSSRHWHHKNQKAQGERLRNFIASWGILFSAAKNSFRYIRPLVRDNALLILAFVVGCEALQIFFLSMHRQLSLAGDLMALPPKLGMILTSLMLFLFYALLIPLRVPEIDQKTPPEQRRGFWDFAIHFTWPYILENVRAFARCLLWLVGGALAAVLLGVLLQVAGLMDLSTFLNDQSFTGGVDLLSRTPPLAYLLALIAFGPFVYYYIAYFFVGYVVLTDPEYEAGKVNPLKRSVQVAKGFVFILILISIVLYMIDAQRTQLRQNLTIERLPVLILATLIFELITIYSNILLFEIYRLKIAFLKKG